MAGGGSSGLLGLVECDGVGMPLALGQVQEGKSKASRWPAIDVATAAAAVAAAIAAAAAAAAVAAPIAAIWPPPPLLQLVEDADA